MPEAEGIKGLSETENAKLVWEFIASTLRAYLDTSEVRVETRATLEQEVGIEHREYLDTVLFRARRGAKMYREVSLVQFAYRIQIPGTNPLDRAPSARSQIGGQLGKFLAEHNIPGTENCFQNRSGGGGTNLARGNEPAFDALMAWMPSATSKQLKACFDYLCAELAALARPVKAMPHLHLVKLTHATVMGLFMEMLSIPSGGNYEQFITAALLDTYHRQHQTGLHVVTKNINATDKSSKSAGDIQAVDSQQPREAYEVTAEDWSTKTFKASATLLGHPSLDRVHIVAKVHDYAKAAQELLSTDNDISVIDLQGFCATMLALLEDTTYRALCLKKLYKNLGSYAQDTKWVNLYVNLLERRFLTVETDRE